MLEFMICAAGGFLIGWYSRTFLETVILCTLWGTLVVLVFDFFGR